MPQMGFRVPAIRLHRLWTMLAHLQAEPVNHSKLGANLEVDGKTVANYIDILTDLLLVRRLEPWHANVKKRLVKSPRYYIRDSGIQHRLLGIDSYAAPGRATRLRQIISDTSLPGSHVKYGAATRSTGPSL